MLSKILKNLLGNFIFYFSFIVPKSSRIWVFGSWMGKSFSDNPKYLYQYVTVHHTQIKAIWLTRSVDVVEQLRANNQTVYLANSLQGIWFSCRAKVGIISHNMYDLNRFAVARMKIVQTWHGIPMKQVLLADRKEESIKKRNKEKKYSIFMPFRKKGLQYSENLVICSTSNYVTKHIFAKCFGKNAPIKVIGFPRLDVFFTPCHHSKLTKQIDLFKKSGKDVGIYMPTYRRQEDEFDIVKYFTQNISKLEKFLSENNKILYLKLHPYEYYKVQNVIKSDSIFLIHDNEINHDIYSILKKMNYLISDYSSIIFDYLVLVKPTYLLVPDRKQYVKINGDFVYDYNEIGIPTSTSWDKLLTQMEKTYATLCAENLHSISNRYHQYYDCHNSQRLYEYILNSI